jgi:metal-sulfur cluster biosynthetic enzyme
VNVPALIDVLRTVYDPELGIDIVALGLLYGVEVEGDHVTVRMTMTSPGCPMGDAILEGVVRTIASRFPGARVSVELLDDPRWDVPMMDPAARRVLGLPA